MKIVKKIIKYSFLSLLFFVSSCETFDLDQTKSPSQVGEEFLDPVYTFNFVQLELPKFVNSANDFTQQVTRQMAMTGGNTYDNAFRDVNFDTNWSQGYRILNAIKLMEPTAIEKEEYYALGASKVIRIYVLLTMVDMYGDIPYSEALLGNENLTPHFDKSADVYKGLLTEIDDAIAVLQLTNNPDSEVQDLYYGSMANWITLAKTLKYKIYHNARLAGSDIGVASIKDAISALLSEGDYIDTETEDFAFRYGTTRINPNSRHPLYNDQYELGGGAYISNYFMWAMTTEKGIDVTPSLDSSGPLSDPRLGFYFFKQVSDPASFSNDDFTLPKRSRPAHYDDVQYKSFYDETELTPYLISNWNSGSLSGTHNGYWGRDHGDNSGIPPDAEQRTCAGVYPIGGKLFVSGNYSVQNSGIDGALGAGIMPMILSSYVHFMIAEDKLVLDENVGEAKAELLMAIEQSIDKVINFAPNYPYAETDTHPVISALELQKTGYINFINNNYNVLSDTKRLELIIKEYYLAAWGNGIEPYNNYRRTGYPSNFQPTLEPASGVFYSTALYPASVANNNPNAPSNVRTKKVFWDKANLNLH
jgi:hypothetical protein